MKIVKGSYSVTFISKLKNNDPSYDQMAVKMIEKVQMQEGFIGFQSSLRSKSLEGITISFWENLNAIKKWSKNEDHEVAKEMGKENWYENYIIVISEVVEVSSYTSG